MPAYASFVNETVSGTPGLGPITLGGAVTGHRTWAAGFPLRPINVAYAVIDGNNREAGIATLNSAGTQLTRTVLESSTTGSLLNLTSAAEVFCSPSGGNLRTINSGQILARVRGMALP